MSYNKLIRTIGGLLCVLICSFALFGCSEEKTKDTIVTYPEEISAIADFKCICSKDLETEFVIDNDDAKELYTYIMEQRKNAVETEIDRTEQDCIYLSFQAGDPLLILSQEPKAEISDALAVYEEHFYGVFWVHENDYMVYTGMPTASFQKYFKMPEGTYERILEMIAE